MSLPSPPSPPLFLRHSNLQSFLFSVTPNVWAKDLEQSGGDKTKCFTLEDLWECYEEWSAYGVGVPVVLSDGESVTQYYVPYLSAIQIYTNNLYPTSRNLKENEDIIGKDETSSKRGQSNKSSSNDSNQAWDDISTDGTIERDGPIIHEKERLGHLYFKYCETCSPYWRIPFAEKMVELAEEYPGLMTLKNVDLSPASWVAVAWYPIYHIPVKGNCKNSLSTCFLTYHTLSSSSQVNSDEDENTIIKPVKDEGGNSVNIEGSLYPFGLVTYRLEEDIWTNPLTYDDYETIIDLHSAADSWLKQLNFWHHDFNFFCSQLSIEGLCL